MTVPTLKCSNSGILLVEDDGPSRALLARRLRRAGFEVREAVDGPSALDRLAAHPVAAVLLDIGLPGMNGVEVLKRIRTMHSASVLPVIMVTAFDQQDWLTEALEAGANDYVTKPIDFNILHARLCAQLAHGDLHNELLRFKERLELILHGSNDGIWEWDLRTDQITHSPRWNELLGRAPAESVDSSVAWMQRIHPAELAQVRAQIEHFTQSRTQQTFRSEYRIARHDGRYLWVLTRGAAQRDEQGNCVRCAGTHTEISALRYNNRYTGLPNQQRLADELTYQLGIARLSEDSNRVGAILLRLRGNEYAIDSSTGEHRAIYALGERLRATLPGCTLVGSGERPGHLILIVRARHDADFIELAQQALDIIRATDSTPSGQPPFQANAGLAVYCWQDAPAADVILTTARLAAREAYTREQDSYMFDTQLEQLTRRRQQLSGELAQAIAADAIAAWFQPIVTATGDLAGFETLARWWRPDGTPVSPGEFIPLVESNGLMPRMTAHLLEQALTRLATWIASGTVGAQTYIAINFPPSLVNSLQLHVQLRDAVRRRGLNPENLCVEVTESNAVTNFADTQTCLQELGNAGFHLALDDFGTGYASLNTLHRLPFDTLKIDQSFVGTMEQQADVRKLIHSIIAIGRALGLKLVAEGVETEAQAAMLRAAGVDRLQGYFIARPMSGATMTDWLNTRTSTRRHFA
ncbi:EAL domain-containing protein [Acidihalobacter ferrooxydans]|uniref:Two-component system response regulator n=1 Tax=Acidihalobacter ferrooxydans TaxID=1765967 RepID=A0A1P8UK45_9GAMM|nr:EAL domain-containing protein [Acidihalobacter ferrooxydans]APZ44203.1 hypothetical protein BW247_14825 [Acidihalobacter ferrooxydans]